MRLPEIEAAWLQAERLNDYRPGDATELEVLRGKTSHVLTIRFGVLEK